jgi:hypothetical protein
MKTIKYDMSEHFASAFVNNDYSGLEETEKKLIKHFIEINSFECLGVETKDGEPIVIEWDRDELTGFMGRLLTYNFKRV